MAAKRSDPMMHVETRSLGRRSLSSNVRRLHDHLNVSLDEPERQEFVQALNDYHYKRNVYDLVYNLRILLDTPEKRQLFSLLRKVIPKSDQALFDMHTSEAFLSKAPGIHRAASMPVASGRPLSRGSVELLNRPVSTISEPEMAPRKPLVPASEPELKTKTYKKTNEPQTFATDSLQDVRKIVIKKPASSKEGMGFSIRGGWEHGVGIYVSCVDPDSLSEKEGLLVGDQILRVNDLNFEKMTHEEAAKIFRVGRKFVLLVRQVGRIPKSYVASQTYTWVDPQGRSISPPPEMDLSGKNPQDSVGRRSGMNLLKDSDERKVNLVVGEGSSLGLMIRGGKEFDLGIYITGVDPYSVAEEAGLKVGDQILDVNSVNFLSISHDEAVRILKTSKHMMMTIKDVGRLPYARTTYDRTQWLMGDQLSQHQVAVFKDNSSAANSTLPRRRKDTESSVFSRGMAPGSQVMLASSSTSVSHARRMIEEQARQLLSDNERGTMGYYLNEYERGNIDVDALVMALFELLDTHSKFSLLSEVRAVVAPRDIDRFDTLVLKQEVESMKGGRPSDSGFSPDRQSENSLSSTISSTNSVRTSSSARLKHDAEGSVEVLIDHINDDTQGLPDFNLDDYLDESVGPEISMEIPTPEEFEPPPPPSHAPPPRPDGKQKVQAEVHFNGAGANKSALKPGKDLGQQSSVSEDSGVDLTLNSNNGSKESKKKSVTISPNPVTIREVHEHAYDSGDDSTLRETSFQTANETPDSSFHSAAMETPPRLTNGREAPDTAPKFGRAPAQMTNGLQEEDVNQRRPEDDRHNDLPDRDRGQGSPTQWNERDRGQRSSPPVKPQQPPPPPPRMDMVNGTGTPRGDSPAESMVSSPSVNHPYLVTVPKVAPTLGIAIEGGANTRQPLPRIITIQPGGSADQSGALQVGHVILEVDGKSLQGLEHKDAARAIAQAFRTPAKDYVQFLVMLQDKS